MDFHVYYNDNAYKKSSRYFQCGKELYMRSKRVSKSSFQDLPDTNISYSHEAGVIMEPSKEVLELEFIQLNP